MSKLSKYMPFWYLILPLPLLWGLGYLMNVLVMTANHGQMPVYLPLYCSTINFGAFHTCMTAGSHLKWMADWINTGVGEHYVMTSPGDLLEMLVEGTWTYCALIWGVLMAERARY